MVYFISRLFYLRAYPVYYDSFEYTDFTQKVTLSNFRQVLLSTHQPIHTFYLLSILWIKQLLNISPELILVLISFLSGLGIVIIFYLWISRADNRKTGFRALLYLLAFPYFFVVTTNIFYESALLFFQLFALYLLWRGARMKKIALIILSATAFFCATSIFIGTLILFPLIIYMFHPLKNKKNIRYLLIFSLIFIFLLFFSDLMILGNLNNLVNKYLSHASDFTSKEGGWFLFVLRVVRNIFIQAAANLSVSGALIFSGALIYNFRKNKEIRPAVYILAVILVILMQYWHAGLYGRLAFFIVLPAAYLLAKTFKSLLKTLLIVLLISATTFHYIRAAGNKPPIYKYADTVNNYQPDQELAVVTSDYNRFLYERESRPLFVIRDRPGIYEDLRVFIDNNLNKNYRVLIDLPAISYPYLQFDGDFYHVLPSNKTISEGMQAILQNYQLEDVVVLEKQAVVFYVISKNRKRNELFLLKQPVNKSYYFPERNAFYYDPVIFIINSLRRLIDFNKFGR